MWNNFDNLDFKGKDDCSKGNKRWFTSTKEGSNEEFVLNGQFIEKNKANAEVSINGDDDYTNNNLNYRYYEPFILKVAPSGWPKDKTNVKIAFDGHTFLDIKLDFYF